MADMCGKCGSSCLFKEPPRGSDQLFAGICDRCKTVTCREFEKWSATETRLIALQSRKVPYFCQECILNLNPNDQHIEKIYDENRRLSQAVLELEEKSEETNSELNRRINQLTHKIRDREGQLSDLRKKKQ